MLHLSNAHHVGPEQCPITPIKDFVDSVSDTGSNSQACTPQQHDEHNKPPSPNLCSNVHYDKRDEVHGVTYHTEDAGNEGWTPVRATKAPSQENCSVTPCTP